MLLATRQGALTVKYSTTKVQSKLFLNSLAIENVCLAQIRGVEDDNSSDREGG